MRFPLRFGLVAGLSLLLAVPILASSAIAQVKVRLSHSALESSNSVWYVAQDRGLYKKNGLDAELLFIPSTTTSVSSLVAGDVQVANASGGGVASAVVAGADLVMVACYLNSLPYELVVSENVKSAEDAGWRGDFVEAEAFAYLAARSVKGLPLSLPSTTGVPYPMPGGRLHRPGV